MIYVTCEAVAKLLISNQHLLPFISTLRQCDNRHTYTSVLDKGYTEVYTVICGIQLR